MTTNKNFKVAIASGKGGTGKSFFSVNLFYTLLKMGEKAELIDCDAEEPNSALFFDLKERGSQEVTQLVPVIDHRLCTYCGECAEWCSYNAIVVVKDKKVATVMEEMCHGCGACSVACKFGAISEKVATLGKVTNFEERQSGAKLVEGRVLVGVYTPVPVLKRAILEAGAPITILDSPPGTSCPFIHTVNSADFTLLITEPTPFGLNDLKLSVEILEGMGKKFAVIINRGGIGDSRVESYLKERGIELLEVIPFSREVAKEYSLGNMVVEQIPSVATIFETIAQKVIEKKGEYNNEN